LAPILNLLPLGCSLFLVIAAFRPVTLSVIISPHSIDAPSMTLLFWISEFVIVEPSSLKATPPYLLGSVTSVAPTQSSLFSLAFAYLLEEL